MPKRKILAWSRADITTIKSIAQNFNTCFLEKHSITSPAIYFMGRIQRHAPKMLGPYTY